MAIAHILYNPLSGKGKCLEEAKLLEVYLHDDVEFFDITRITNNSAFLQGMEADDYLVIAGGDGTLNRFANDTDGIEISQKILYFPTGTGNDFACDLGKKPYSNPFPINQYIKQLPTVEVKGKTYRFLNAVGFGIDGYCCQVGDELRKSPDKKVNYTAIAIKGLLRHYSPKNAKITVDGVAHTFQKVWIAPTMNGKYYGGGMMAAPDQDRISEDRTLSLMIFHGAGRLRTLCVFPSIFQGEHIKYTRMVTVLTGHEITVEFDQPAPLQIDGETILDVTEYTARSALCDSTQAADQYGSHRSACF